MLPSISIVSPMFNESGNVAKFAEVVVDVMRASGEVFELILVDDGSSDATWLRICEACAQYPEVVGVELSRNFGLQGALMAGLHEAKGEAIISMDGDLQHPPASLPEMIEAWRAGAEIVLTRRMDATTTPFFKRKTSAWFYKLFSSLADTSVEPGSSDFRLLDRKALRPLLRMRYGIPFLRGAVQTLGFRTRTIEYQVGERFAGVSKYTLSKMLLFARSGLISHSSVPLRAGIYLGVVTGFLGIGLIIYALFAFIAHQTVPGWASTIIVISFLFSILFFMLGVIGLYIDDMHSLLKEKPHFIISSVAREPEEKRAVNENTDHTAAL